MSTYFFATDGTHYTAKIISIALSHPLSLCSLSYQCVPIKFLNLTSEFELRASYYHITSFVTAKATYTNCAPSYNYLQFAHIVTWKSDKFLFCQGCQQNKQPRHKTMKILTSFCILVFCPTFEKKKLSHLFLFTIFSFACAF